MSTYECCEHCEAYLECPEAKTGHSIPCPDGCELDQMVVQCRFCWDNYSDIVLATHVAPQFDNSGRPIWYPVCGMHLDDWFDGEPVTEKKYPALRIGPLG